MRMHRSTTAKLLAVFVAVAVAGVAEACSGGERSHEGRDAVVAALATQIPWPSAATMDENRAGAG